jgi:hypothetical protein
LLKKLSGKDWLTKKQSGYDWLKLNELDWRYRLRRRGWSKKRQNASGLPKRSSGKGWLRKKQNVSGSLK